MKHTKRNLVVAVALISVSSLALAFGPAMTERGPGAGYRIAQELNLTTEQQEQVKSIMTQHRDEAVKMRKQHRDKLKDKLSDVLSTEQMEKFDAMKAQGRYSKNKMGKAPCGKRPF